MLFFLNQTCFYAPDKISAIVILKLKEKQVTTWHERVKGLFYNNPVKFHTIEVHDSHYEVLRTVVSTLDRLLP